MARYLNAILVVSILLSSVIELSPSGGVFAQSGQKPSSNQGARRNPFSLPPGIRLLSKEAPVPQEVKNIPSPVEMKPVDVKPVEPALKLKAILIGDHVRLASINRSIVTVGDMVQGEKVLEIRPDRVILEKDGKKRTLVLEQSPIKITVEDR